MNVVSYKKENEIATITLNRPESLNSLNKETLVHLSKFLKIISADDSIRILIITGSGSKAFAAGADIQELMSMSKNEAYEFVCLGHKVFKMIEDLKQPTIAAVNGFALGGGCELALSCDLRIASETAKFGLPEVSLGIIPGFGGTQRLPRLIGTAKSMEFIFTGSYINALDALRIGLVNQVVEPTQLNHKSSDLARNILKNGPIAVSLAKRAIRQGLELNIEQGCELEISLFCSCFDTFEQKEGMAALMEKRPANFK